jgi:hypothetical protein
MLDASDGQPALHKTVHPYPGGAVGLATAPKRTMPVPRDLLAELLDRMDVGWDRMVIQVTPNHTGEPHPLLLDG